MQHIQKKFTKHITVLVILSLLGSLTINQAHAWFASQMLSGFSSCNSNSIVTSHAKTEWGNEPSYSFGSVQVDLRYYAFNRWNLDSSNSAQDLGSSGWVSENTSSPTFSSPFYWKTGGIHKLVHPNPWGGNPTVIYANTTGSFYTQC